MESPRGGSQPPEKPQLTKGELTKYVKAFIYDDIQNLPFAMTINDINKRNELRRDKVLSVVGGLVGVNAAGFYFYRKYPNYRKPIMGLSLILSFGVYIGGDILVHLDARKYLRKKLGMKKSGTSSKEGIGNTEKVEDQNP